MAAGVEGFGGRVLRCALFARSGDPAGFLDFPDDLSARAWNIFYASQEGVLTSQIDRMLDNDDLDATAAKVELCRSAAEAHRDGTVD
jgi:hypothetical protein